MKSSELIKQLLELPLNSEIIMTRMDGDEYKYYNTFFVIEYDDGTIGIMCEEEKK